jgi:hypothetical protein
MLPLPPPAGGEGWGEGGRSGNVIIFRFKELYTLASLTSRGQHLDLAIFDG